MEPEAFRAAVARDVAARGLIPAGAEVVCLVSGGPDSTCLWHVLRALGHRVRAVHVDHGLRGAESDEDARFCREALGAEVVDGRGGRTEDELRRIRYAVAPGALRATGHTLDDQAETVLYRLATSGAPGGIRWRREDGVVRPLLGRRRAAAAAYCAAEGLAFRTDSSNPDSVRGLLRREVLPALERVHPAAVANLARAAERRTMPPALAQLIGERAGSRRLDLGRGLVAVREQDRLWLERGPVALDGPGPVAWGPWRIESARAGLKVRSWRAGDRLAGRSKKIQDVFVDAKIPRSEREAWPLVVRGDDVVAVPGIVEADGVRAWREDE